MSTSCAVTNQMRRVELLRESLEQSLKNLKQQQQHSVRSAGNGQELSTNQSQIENSSGVKKEQFAGSIRRPLCIIFQSPTTAVIQISGSPHRRATDQVSRFQVSPIPNAPPAMRLHNSSAIYSPKTSTSSPISRPNPSSSPPSKPLRVIVPQNNPVSALASPPPDSGFGTGVESSDNETKAPKTISEEPNSTLQLGCSPASSIDSGFASPAAGEFILPLSPMLHTTNSTNTYPGTKRPILKYNFPATGHPNPQLAEEQLECGLKFRQRSASECFIEASRRLFIGRRSKSEGQDEAVREAKKQTANSILTAITGRKGGLSSAKTPPSCLVQHSTAAQNNSTNGLKGILKKPPPVPTEPQPAGSALKRTSTRFTGLSRSVSECLGDGDLTQAFNGMVLNQLCNASQNSNSTATQGSDSSINTEPATNPGSGDSSQDESAKMNGDDEGLEPKTRTKRVSFSEHVQARIYRSNSSILGQKKKNEKKQRSKRRRSESESNESSTSVEHSSNDMPKRNGTVKATAEMTQNNNEIGITQNANLQSSESYAENITPFSRRDSGIGEIQEIVSSSELVESSTPPPTPPVKKPAFSAQANYPCSITQNVIASKRVRRLVSSDSAIGEEVLMEEIEA
ncbi:protein kintoun [Ditylenchus destructor]|nr:protein kintoun [Ditylenchus destructor]